MRTHSTEHLKVPAFKPANLITLLDFPEGSYRNPRTEKIPNAPYSRKLIFYQFSLLDKVPKIPSMMREHKIYADYQIAVHLTKMRALEITLTRHTNLAVEELDVFPSSPKITNVNKPEYDKIKTVVKNVVGGKSGTDYIKFRSAATIDGYECVFIGLKKTSICDSVVKNLQQRYPNFLVTGLVNGVGLYIAFTKPDTGNLQLPYGLKELLPTKDIELVEYTEAPITEAVAPVIKVTATPFKAQIINAIQSLMASGMSIKTIQTELDCSPMEMLELLDINSTVLLFPSIEKLGKLSNTTFTI